MTFTKQFRCSIGLKNRSPPLHNRCPWYVHIFFDIWKPVQIIYLPFSSLWVNYFRNSTYLCSPTTHPNHIIMNILLLCGDIEVNPGPGPGDSHEVRLKNLSLCHLNIRSLLAHDKLDDITDFLSTFHPFDIIALTETHLSTSILDETVNLDNYTIYRKDREERWWGSYLYY
jgi:hypothetical protein